MAVPRAVSYDPVADVTDGFISRSAAVGSITINGVALVTWWLSNAWSSCSNAVSTSWSDCAAAVSTTWTDCASQPVTTWTEVEDT